MAERQLADATKSVGEPDEGTNEWGQVVAALVVVGGLAALLLKGTFQ